MAEAAAPTTKRTLPSMNVIAIQNEMVFNQCHSRPRKAKSRMTAHPPAAVALPPLMTSASDSEALRRMGDLGVPMLARTLRHRDKAALSLALAVAGASSGVQASERLTSGKSSGEELAVAAPVSLPEAEELLGASTSRLEDMAEDARKVRIQQKNSSESTQVRHTKRGTAGDGPTRSSIAASHALVAFGRQLSKLVVWSPRSGLRLERKHASNSRTCNLDASLLEAGVSAL